MNLLFLISFSFYEIIYSKYHGEITAYGDDWKGNNCGFDHTWRHDAESHHPKVYFAAMNAPQWNSGYQCGRCVRVQCTSKACAHYPSVTLMVLNQCPECKKGDLDVSDKAFHAITGSTPSRYHIQWEYTTCSKEFVEGDMEMHLKEGSNPHFIALQARNHLQPIEKVEIIQKNGEKIPMENPEKNWITSWYFLARPKHGLHGKFKIRTTAKDGSVIEHHHSKLWKAGTSIKTKQQFGRPNQKAWTSDEKLRQRMKYELATKNIKKSKVVVAKKKTEEKTKTVEKKKAVEKKTQKKDTKVKAEKKKTVEKQQKKVNKKKTKTVEKETKKIKAEKKKKQRNLEGSRSGLIPLYGRGCNEKKLCGDFNGHPLQCTSYGMCICKHKDCEKSAKSIKAAQYEECSLQRPCYGHGQACGFPGLSCQTVQEPLQCFQQKHSKFAQCLILSECQQHSNYHCTPLK